MSRTYRYRPSPAFHPLLLSTPIVREGSAQIPSSSDLRNLMGPVRDQGQEGCCSGFSTAALMEGLQAGAQQPFQQLSPAYLYWRTRLAEGSFPQDSGATIADEIQTLSTYGVCPEDLMPYTGNSAEAGTPADDEAAALLKCAYPLRLSTLPAVIKPILVSKPVVFGMPVCQSFENTGADGMIPMPSAGEQPLGGHAMLAVGYDDAKQCVLIRNSWGPGWALSGYAWMPYDMVLSWYEAWTGGLPS